MPEVARWVRAPLVAAGAVGVLVVALEVGGGSPRPAEGGLPDAGALTGWGLPVARLAMDLAAAITVGSLLFALLVPSRNDVLDSAALRAIRAAAGWGWAWAAASTGTLLLTMSDFLGVPVGRLDYQETLASFITQTPQGRALAVVVLLTVLLAASARSVRTVNGSALLLVLSIAAALPPALTGHSATAADHDLATSSLLVHVVAVTIWVGGLFALTLYGRAPTKALATAARRFSGVAIYCFGAAAASGLLNAWIRLGGLGGLGNLVDSRYGWLVLGKLTALGVLGWFGYRHRRRTLVRLDRGEPGAFRRFALGEAAVMAATIGLAVALSRTPTPVSGSDETSAAAALVGHPVPPVSLERLLSAWRPDAVVLMLAGLAVAWYVAGVRRLRSNDVRWPVGRTAAWLGGVGVVVVVLCGGVATYAPAMFSVHMVQHMALAMLAPVLLAAGAPVTLALRALPAAPHASGDRGLREWLLVLLHSRVAHVLGHPVVVLVLSVATLYAFYFSPLFGWLMRSHAGHLAMTAHFLAVGSVFFWTVIGLDPAPRRLPPLDRMLLLFASVPFHAFFGVVVMSSISLIGGEWYGRLALPWVDPLADQNLGGGIAWAAAEIPTLVVLGVLFAQWYRADDRAARRADRRAEAGTDRDRAAYNAWLARLADRDVS